MGKQMLTLSGRVVQSGGSSEPSGPRLYSLSTQACLPAALRSKKAFLIQEAGLVPTGFKHYFHLEGVDATITEPE